MEKRFAVPLFIPALPAIDVNTVYTPAIGDIQAIWQAIEAVRPPSTLPFPQHTGSTPSVTESTIAIKKRHKLKSIAGWMLVAAGVVVFSYSASLFLVAAILIGIGAVNIAQKIPGGEEATRRYTDIQTRIFQAESEWRQQSSGAEFLSLKSDLKNKKDAYDALPAEEKRRVEDHNRNRRAIQLSTYLDTFQIRQFKIPKVGPTKQAMLVSYGIETAGDVNEAAVLRVPGFGPRTSQPLLNWRRHLESRFKYTPSPNASDVVAINAIRTDIAAKALRLKTELTNGAAILSQLPAAIVTRQKSNIPFIETLLTQRAQAEADLQALGLKIPNVPRPTASVCPSPHFATNPVQARPAFSSATHCPKCNSLMVVRQARRGANRGGKFYGCTHYPACNGTQPYP